MTLSAAWWRVARGVSQVAQHWTSEHALHAERTAVRVVQHTVDLGQKGAGPLAKQVQGGLGHVAQQQAQVQQIIMTALNSIQTKEQQQQHYHQSPYHQQSSDQNANQKTTTTSNGSQHKASPMDTMTPSKTIFSNGAPERQTTLDPQATLLEEESADRSSPDIVNVDDMTPNYTTSNEAGVAVPATRIARAWGFARLGMSLVWGTAKQGAVRWTGQARTDTDGSSESSILVHESNADQVAATLCRMRGAALKLGQMLSIQDASLLPPALHRALAQVRQGSTHMPTAQLHAQLDSQLGTDWRTRCFATFDDRPLAAASIGQVHLATTMDGRKVVVKVQFPGVAQSITSDLDNLGMLVKWSNLAPKGLFLDNIIRVGKQELSVECDYKRELQQQERIRQLVASDSFLAEQKFVVPATLPELSTSQVLTSEYRRGGTIDKVAGLSAAERNRIGRAILYLTMQELFVWRFMQTDPNWGNFLYDTHTGTTSLIDFGAARAYDKDFVDGYLRIVWAAANRDGDTLMEQSHRMGFLTGDENDAMQRAHLLSGFTVGEPFQQSKPFDFKASRISSRMGEHTSVFLRHRLTAPPAEVYTLHRKLAGAYMLCIQLGAVVSSRDLLETIVRNHVFEDGLPHPITFDMIQPNFNNGHRENKKCEEP